MNMLKAVFRFDSLAAGLFLLSGLAVPLPSAALTSNWIVQNDNGNWNNEANWDNGIPMAPGDIAVITNLLAMPVTKTITIDTAVSLKALKFATPTTASNGFNIVLGTSGSLTMNSGDGSHSVIQQLRGSGRNKVSAAVTLSNDVDVVNSTGAATYFDVSCPISGSHNIHINPDGSTAQPYLTAANTFVGDTTVYAGKLLFSADCFGNTGSGTRVITLVSNSYLRVNYGAAGGAVTLAGNRQIVSGVGGGGIDGNGRIVILNAADQFAGTNTFTLRNQNNGLGGLHLGGANNGFAGSLFVDLLQSLRFGSDGSLSNAPLICLLNASAAFDVRAKAGGYTMPSNQVLAGIGVVSGLVNVASAATLHPGSYALPGPVTAPGILSFTDGGLTFANGGTYAWELKQLKDNAFPPGITTYSSITVTDGGVSLDGGVLTLNFNGIATPDSADPFWQTGHVWTILTAAAPPAGTLTVTNGIYTDWAFTTQVSGNTLELVYGPYSAPPQGTLISVQ